MQQGNSLSERIYNLVLNSWRAKHRYSGSLHYSSQERITALKSKVTDMDRQGSELICLIFKHIYYPVHRCTAALNTMNMRRWTLCPLSFRIDSTKCISQTTKFKLQVKTENRKARLSKVISMLHKQNIVVYLIYISQCIFTGKFHGIDLHSRSSVQGLILTHLGGQKEHKRPCGANKLVVHLHNGQKTEVKLQWYLNIKISVTAINIFQTYYTQKTEDDPLINEFQKWQIPLYLAHWALASDWLRAECSGHEFWWGLQTQALQGLCWPKTILFHPPVSQAPEKRRGKKPTTIKPTLKKPVISNTHFCKEINFLGSFPERLSSSLTISLRIKRVKAY